jgi:hypothetical protein
MFAVKNNSMAKRRRTDNTMVKRRRTDNTMAKRRRTDNTMAKRRRTDNTMAKRLVIFEHFSIVFLRNLAPPQSCTKNTLTVFVFY